MKKSSDNNSFTMDMISPSNNNDHAKSLEKNREESGNFDVGSSLYKLSTIHDLNPNDMRKINYNPYKKRDKFDIDESALNQLKEMSKKEVSVVVLPKKNDKISARFLEKIKKRKELEAAAATATSNQNNQTIDSTTNVVPESKNDNESDLKSNPINYFNSYRNPNLKKNTDEKIYIDNCEFLRTNLNDISKKILEKCKFTHAKSKNANTSLKVGQGKLMMTNGMTVSDFTKAYHLNA